MLIFDPRKRINNVDALKHEYLAELADPTDEPESDPVTIYDFEFELNSFTTEQYKGTFFLSNKNRHVV